jgi:hypothetical protein
MAVSLETAKREMAGALIDIFKLRAAPHVTKVENCTTMVELRQAVFTIADVARNNDPDKAKQLISEWAALEGA